MKYRLGTKLHLITGCALLGVAVILGVCLLSLKAEVDRARMTKTKHLVEAVVSVLARFEADEKAIRLSRERAQEEALATIQMLRYGSRDYFWIDDMQPRMINIRSTRAGSQGSI